MLQRLLLTTSLTGGQWVIVLALSLIAPLEVAADKVFQLRQLDREAHATALVQFGAADGPTPTDGGASAEATV